MGSGAAIAVREGIGDGIIVTGDGNISIQGDSIHSNVKVRKDSNIISGEQAFERMAAAVRLNLKQLESNIIQARLESNQFFKLTLIFSSLGFIIVLAAIILLFVGQIAGGIVTATSSIIPEVTALLFFNKDKELRKTIEAYHKHMLESQQVHTMIDVAETITNSSERDIIKQEIILKVLNIDNPLKSN